MACTVYQMCVVNAAAYLRGDENREAVEDGQGISAFTASTILSAAFCKDKEEVLADLISFPTEKERE